MRRLVRYSPDACYLPLWTMRQRWSVCGDDGVSILVRRACHMGVLLLAGRRNELAEACSLGRCAWTAADRLHIFLGRSAALAPGATLRLGPIRCRGGVRATPSPNRAASLPRLALPLLATVW